MSSSEMAALNSPYTSSAMCVPATCHHKVRAKLPIGRVTWPYLSHAWTAPDLVGSSYLDDLAAELQPPHGSEDERRGGHVDVQEREIIKDGGVRVTGW